MGAARRRGSPATTLRVYKTASFRFRVFCSPEPVFANGGNFLYTTWGRLHNEICVFLTWPLLIELQSAHQRRCSWLLQDRRLRTFPRLAIFVCVCPEPVLANTRYNSSEPGAHSNTLYAFFQCTPVRTTAATVVITGGAARKRHFFELSLCLSRACLGKIMHFIYKWLKKCRFLTWRRREAATQFRAAHVGVDAGTCHHG